MLPQWLCVQPGDNAGFVFCLLQLSITEECVSAPVLAFSAQYLFKPLQPVTAGLPDQKAPLLILIYSCFSNPK